ncbi:MAG: PHP domain-containing protein, partial [Clostridia bacterium]|nr:PHP domain-containing protein [Clostridia bacterium]
MTILEQFTKKFNRVSLTSEDKELISRMQSLALKVDKENKRIEIHASFDAPERPRRLFALEDEIRAAYGLNTVRIFPTYPRESFSESRVPGLIALLNRVTGEGVSYGFLEDCTVQFDPVACKLELRLRQHVSPSFVEHSGTARFLSESIRGQYGLDVEVVITGEEVDPSAYEAAGVAAMKATAHEDYLAETAKAREQALNESKSMALEFFGPEFASPEQTPDGKTLLYVGNMTLDITEPKPCYGTLKNRNPLIPIKQIRADSFVAFAGRLFSWEEKENYDKPKNTYKMFVTDGEASVMLRFQAEKGAPFPKAPAYVIVEGKAQFSDFDGEIVVRASAMATVKALSRKETNPTPRVELHCHTNMSAMDAMTDPALIMRRAQEWGCPAIAFTDHGNLQSFPEVMKATKKCPDVKPIYGMEGYLVDDTARAVFFYSEEKDNKNFEKDEFVIFDIETTGLSVANCGITQIAASIYRGGQTVDTFETFVNPGMPIPQNITELTGITDEMVADAPSVKDAVEAFLRFAGGRMLVAHNASFDASFIRKACNDYDMAFDNPCLDTVALSRYINADSNRHTLDALAKYFKLGEFDHHRANADTEMLSLIFGQLARKLASNGIFTTNEMVTAMAENSDPKKLKNTYHIILLAKNYTGLKNLYKLVSYSYLDYFNRHPRIPKTVLREHREGLIIGSACIAGELYQAVLENKPFGELCKIAELYDYLEIQPWTNNWFMFEDGKLGNDR